MHPIFKMYPKNFEKNLIVNNNLWVLKYVIFSSAFYKKIVPKFWGFKHQTKKSVSLFPPLNWLHY
jgi:hypothetical protein